MEFLVDAVEDSAWGVGVFVASDTELHIHCWGAGQPACVSDLVVLVDGDGVSGFVRDRAEVDRRWGVGFVHPFWVVLADMGSGEV